MIYNESIEKEENNKAMLSQAPGPSKSIEDQLLPDSLVSINEDDSPLKVMIEDDSNEKFHVHDDSETKVHVDDDPINKVIVDDVASDDDGHKDHDASVVI